MPGQGPKLAEELRHVGAEIEKQAEKELAEFYPCLPAGRRPTPVAAGRSCGRGYLRVYIGDLLPG